MIKFLLIYQHILSLSHLNNQMIHQLRIQDYQIKKYLLKKNDMRNN